MTSPSSGYITNGGNTSENDDRPWEAALTRHVAVPPRYALMISLKAIQQLKLFRGFHSPYGYITLYYEGGNMVLWSAKTWQCGFSCVCRYYNTDVKFSVERRGCIKESNTSCFQLFFSLFADSKAPRKLPSRLWNCSVEHYAGFQHHFHCNLRTECEDGRDETAQCPFSSADCQGLVAFCDTCYKFVLNEMEPGEDLDTYERDMKTRDCGVHGGTLSFPMCVYDPLDVISQTLKRRWLYPPHVDVGLCYDDPSLPNMYRHSMIRGYTVLYHSLASGYSSVSHKNYTVCRRISLTSMEIMRPVEEAFTFGKFICEVTANNSKSPFAKDISLATTHWLLPQTNRDMTVQQDGHVTYTFLLCAPHQGTGRSQEHKPNCYRSYQKSHRSMSPSTKLVITTFTCNDENTTLSYTLICDFVPDCLDSSDESFCKHPICDRSFTCADGQCTSFENVCDHISHCYDESDERHCIDIKELKVDHPRFPSPALIMFDGIKLFIVTAMNSSEPCPDSHYRCPGEFNDCLPVYTRCNGMYDCIDQHDEAGCGEMKCPGFFRCRLSTICLHSDNMCDGWSHCPQHDDELWCSGTCPGGCLCQPHAFLCLQPFPAQLFPHIRSLDATGSGMTLSEVSSHVYLIHLVLANCSLIHVSEMSMVNLRSLDLRGNKLQHVNMTAFVALENVQSLSLAANPITSLHADASDPQHSVLVELDLSRTMLTVLDSTVLQQFPRLQKLNISFTSIETISPEGFRIIPLLTELHLEGSPVKTFPPDIFKDLVYLHFISTSNYKLCCNEVLPLNTNPSSCHAPKDEISSCEDLLQSWAYRAFLWLITCLAVSGNIFCFCARLFARSMTSSSGFSVFVTSLTMADFLMGVYMAIIGVADEQFRSRYLHFDDVWKSSVTCKVAGFLSLLSSEVSALIICLITLDRFIVLCFPFSNLRFERTSAGMVCLLIWLTGCCLALLPLLPVTSHWEFYSQTGICIPLPVTRKDFKGKVYSFGVLIVLNFVLFLLISCGQVFIYWSIQKNALKISSTKISQDMTIARRLITIALTDFLCWFPIGLCGMLAVSGTPIPGEVNVALAIFVLPLNSAINPFMYTFNTLAEKRRKLKESNLLKWMESHPDLIPS